MRIVIEGNIGAGKSTIISKINNDFRLPVFLEPVSEWMLLSDFYDNKKRFAFSFNVEVLLSFHNWKNNHFNAVYERSPTSCRNVFTEISYDSGHITQKELVLFDNLYKLLSWKNDIIIYIRTDPKLCFERMKIRNRSCEKSVTLEYLNKVHQKHEDLMKLYKKNDIPVYIIDGDNTLDIVYKDVIQTVSTILTVRCS
jgi:deoxyadenosine/deoxycytidine kinase